MPRLIVPSRGGGTKLMRTLLGGAAEGEGDPSGVGETEGDSSGVSEREVDSSDVGEGVGAGDSCAAAITAIAIHDAAIRNPQLMPVRLGPIRDSSIIAPVHVRKKVIAPFTIAQKFFIHIVSCKLIVQSIEAGKMIHRAFGCVFACRSGFHEECPVA